MISRCMRIPYDVGDYGLMHPVLVCSYMIGSNPFNYTLVEVCYIEFIKPSDHESLSGGEVY